jgi:hypothetical protein
LFYNWQRTFFENGAKAFEGTGNGRGESKSEKQVEALESRLQRKHEVLSELMEEHIRLKKSWGDLNGEWIAHDIRDVLVDFVRSWSEKSEISYEQLLRWIEVSSRKFREEGYAKWLEENSKLPRRRKQRSDRAKGSVDLSVRARVAMANRMANKPQRQSRA